MFGTGVMRLVVFSAPNVLGQNKSDKRSYTLWQDPGVCLKWAAKIESLTCKY